MDPIRSDLARHGFADTWRSARFLAAPELAAFDHDALIDDLARTADPDLALLALLRLEEAGAELTQEHPEWQSVVRILGGSHYWGDQLVAHPELIADLYRDPFEEDVRAVYSRIAASLAPSLADPRGFADAVVQLRRTYRWEMLGIVSQDLDDSAASREAAQSAMPHAGRAIANLVGATLEGALSIARYRHPEAAEVPFAIIAMGKTGAEELNYISDVDVIYVCEGDDAAIGHATQLATEVQRIVSEVGPEPPLWPLDANLRPEGKDGPLVRTLDSHIEYYKRWAKTWEFQALLKARPVAGDSDLGQRYIEALSPMVWSAVEREHFVEDSQAMRRRVESNVKAREAERHLKLGQGGLRDVEFTVQLLQLVHGRTDETLRKRNTLDALAALAAGGYVGRDDALELRRCYEFLRALEHRIQLDRMRRSHVVPNRPEELRRLSRLLGVLDVDREWAKTRRRVRELHEAIFYRPLLPLTAQLSASELRLSGEAATARLQAIGYQDPAGAMRNIAALTEGISRRAAIQRQLLPVMLGWFAQGPRPDTGLLEFRRFSEQLGSTHWYLKLLRDNGVVAERFATILASSQWSAEAVSRMPEAVQWLGDEEELAPYSAGALVREAESMLKRRTERADRIGVGRYLRRRELTRAALGDVLAGVEPERAVAITDAADAAVQIALQIALDEARQGSAAEDDPASFAVIAMGRMGGREMAYASDADVMFVYEAHGDEQAAVDFAMRVATGLRLALTDAHEEPKLDIDTDLRPEGRRGPLVRSLGSYAEYYERWVDTWECQALLRARPIAGDTDLQQRFVELIDPVRYPEGGLSQTALIDVRRMKARVESERMPRGAAPNRHLKLGRGGLTDVEFTAQLLQLQHGWESLQLRTTSTLEALRAARDSGLITNDDFAALSGAWTLASRVRDAIVLGTGRVQRSDILPGLGRDLVVVSRVLGYGPGQSQEFEEDYLRTARRARKVVERILFE